MFAHLVVVPRLGYKRNRGVVTKLARVTDLVALGRDQTYIAEGDGELLVRHNVVFGQITGFFRWVGHMQVVPFAAVVSESSWVGFFIATLIGSHAGLIANQAYASPGTLSRFFIGPERATARQKYERDDAQQGKKNRNSAHGALTSA